MKPLFYSLIVLLLLCKSSVSYSQDALSQSSKYDETANPFVYINVASSNVVKRTAWLGVQELYEVNIDSVQEKDIYYQALMTGLVVVGEIEERDRIQKLREYNSDSLFVENAKAPDKLSVRPAKDVFLEKADEHRVIMLNEAHTCPEHRVFLKSLLKELYTKGYKTICFEDIRGEDTLVYTSKNCPADSSGFYIREPNMGETVRTSLKIGYSIKCYDAAGVKRDSIAASTLKNIYTNLPPNEKLIVFCGHGHNRKISPRNNTLAYYFKEMTGVEPFTVEQTLLLSKPTYYADLVAQLSIEQPSVVLDENSHPYNFESIDRDLYIVTPPTRYISGRPHWLFELDNRIPYTLETSLQEGIIEVYYHNSSLCLEEIPVDVILIKGSENTVALYEGYNYICKIYDMEYNLIETMEINNLHRK